MSLLDKLGNSRLSAAEIHTLLSQFENFCQDNRVKIAQNPLKDPVSGDFVFYPCESKLYNLDNITYNRNKQKKVSSSREILKVNKEAKVKCVYFDSDAHNLQRRVYSLIDSNSAVLVHYLRIKEEKCFKLVDVNPLTLDSHCKTDLTLVFESNFKLTDPKVFADNLMFTTEILAKNVIKVLNITLPTGNHILKLLEKEDQLCEFEIKTKGVLLYPIASFNKNMLLDCANTKIAELHSEMQGISQSEDIYSDDSSYFSLKQLEFSSVLKEQLKELDNFGYSLLHYLAALGWYSSMLFLFKVMSPFTLSKEALTPYEVASLFWNLV